ncbi:MAG: DUF6242 domain-containing protein [Bacteroidales bacterium]
MNIKKLIPLIVLFIGIITTNCTNNDSTTTDYTISDAQIKSFKLVNNDSILSDLDEVKFSINQQSGNIYNQDSLPFGTILKEKLLTEITFNGAHEAKVITIDNDTSIYTTSDSIDFNSPIKMIVTAHDKKTTKEYTIRVNIHQVDPDSMVWQNNTNEIQPTYKDLRSVLVDNNIYCIAKNDKGINSIFKIPANIDSQWEDLGETNIPGIISQLNYYNGNYYAISVNEGLFKSNNGVDWELLNPDVESILGTINKEFVYVTNNNEERSVVTTKDFATYKSKKINSEFPSYGFATAQYTNGVERLIILGGKKLNSETTNAVYHIYIDKDEINISGDIHSKNGSWKAREGLIAKYYDQTLYLFSGNNGNNYYDDIYTSINGGINWKLSTSKSIIPDSYGKRSYANIHLDDNNALWLVGGKNNTTSYNDIWKVQINKLK